MCQSTDDCAGYSQHRLRISETKAIDTVLIGAVVKPLKILTDKENKSRLTGFVEMLVKSSAGRYVRLSRNSTKSRGVPPAVQPTHKLQEHTQKVQTP